MNNSATKVGEIFREAGTAFSELSKIIRALHFPEEPSGADSFEEDLESLHNCVNRFAVELNHLSQHIKKRTITQIRTTLKKKAFEDAGIPLPTRQVSSTVTSQKKQSPRVVIRRAAPVARLAPVASMEPEKLIAIHPPPLAPPTALGQNAEVTLNMLNASVNEDVDALGGDVKLEFESTNDEVGT